MKKKIIFDYIITSLLFALFIMFTIIVAKIDVNPIGPKDSSIGLSNINQKIFNEVGTNMTWYHVTDWMGIIGIVVAMFYAILAIVQWIKRKSFKKVDYQLLILGSFYILVIAIYVLFEKISINYRPVLIDGYLESSYPSTHTLVTICILTTSMFMINYLVKNKYVIISLDLASMLIMGTIVIGRLVSGVHWFTDILGGLILSSALVMLFYSSIKYVEFKNTKNIN